MSRLFTIPFWPVYTASVRRLHMTVVFATFLPGIALAIQIMEGQGTLPKGADSALPACFALELFLIFPAAILYLGERKIRGLGLFLLLGLFDLTAVFYLSAFIETQLLHSHYPGLAPVLNSLLCLLFLFDAIRMRINNNERARARRENDPSYQGSFSFLPEPHLLHLLWFLLLYISGMSAKSSAFCSVALLGAILYFFLVFSYFYLTEREKYLNSMIGMRSMPTGRIRRTTDAFLLIMLLLGTFFAILAVLLSDHRLYIDLSRLRFSTGMEQIYPAEEMMMTNPFLQYLMALSEGGKPLPAWFIRVIDLFWDALEILAAGLILYGLFRAVLSTFRSFRGVDEENGDEIIPLASEEKSGIREMKLEKPRSREESRIRKRYKKTILRYRKMPPEPSETPSEMEEKAGLPKTEEMAKLHRDYELARYGKTGS